jgi:hypothetical protein
MAEEEEEEEEHSSDDDEEEVVVESDEENEVVEEPQPSNTKRMKLQHDDGGGTTSSEMMVEEAPAAEPQPAPGGDLADLMTQMEFKTSQHDQEIKERDAKHDHQEQKIKEVETENKELKTENKELKSEKAKHDQEIKESEARVESLKRDLRNANNVWLNQPRDQGAPTTTTLTVESSAQNQELMAAKRKITSLTTENGELKCTIAYLEPKIPELTEKLRKAEEAAAAAVALECTSRGGTVVIRSAPPPPGETADLRMKLEMEETQIYNQEQTFKVAMSAEKGKIGELNKTITELLQ